MSKKESKSKSKPAGKFPARTQEQDSGKKKLKATMFGIGIGMLILGYLCLTQVDKMAQNWAGFVSPVLIVGAYIVMIISILL